MQHRSLLPGSFSLLLVVMLSLLKSRADTVSLPADIVQDWVYQDNVAIEINTALATWVIYDSGEWVPVTRNISLL